MKKTALIFLLAIFVPALILGGLALRTASQQRIIIEQQEAELRQAETDRVAEAIREALNREQQTFVQAVQELVANTPPEVAARDFTARLREKWPLKCIGFAVKTSGEILSPARETAAADSKARDFLQENTLFLGNAISAEVYQSAAPAPREEAMAASESKTESGKELANRADADRAQKKDSGDASYDKRSRSSAPGAAPQMGSAPAKQTNQELQRQKELAIGKTKPLELNQQQYQYRKVAPQNFQPSAQEQLVSQLNVASSRFNQLVSVGREGSMARFVQDSLAVVFWVKPAATDSIVFGAQIDPADLRDLIESIPLTANSGWSRSGPEVCLAVLDDHAQPFSRSISEFATDWKSPFVATEIGEILPHWEVALYLVDPARLSRSVRLVNLTLIGLISLALGAIAWGSYLVVADTRRQLALVQKKTDFVSNVSHELKTPLTSIRMFAELLHEKRVQDPEKVSAYLRIITLEAERLTRLINNVLDFAKLERGQKRYNKRPLDLHSVIARVWEAQELHLRESGFETSWQAGSPPYPVLGDEDALAQVIVNLLSNAEKYSLETKSVELHSYVNDGRVCVSVLDRGIGVPKGDEKKIFEHFYRAHDSLSSAVQGSGLGLTLAKRIAEDHGGTVRFSERAGGGSSFTLELPVKDQNA